MRCMLISVLQQIIKQWHELYKHKNLIFDFDVEMKKLQSAEKR